MKEDYKIQYLNSCNHPPIITHIKRVNFQGSIY